MIKGIETPRIYTPPLRELTPDTSLGFEIIDFAETVLHIDLIPWQIDRDLQAGNLLVLWVELWPFPTKKLKS